ncbi:NAD(P)H-dependent glycerol-3-phosphate dehydrogenase [soil metagenome]
MERVAILGTGGMGSALALLLARSGHPVRLWGRDPAQVEQIVRDRENRRHLAGIPLPEEVEPTADAERATGDADLIIAAIPSAFLRSTLSAVAGQIPQNRPVVSVVKGIERATFARPTEVIRAVLGPRPIAVLSGPSHAEELARGLPASVVVAGPVEALNLRVQTLLNSDRLRVYTNPDAIGVELAGALKNVLGVAAGICDGLNLGDNTKAALLTRGLAEMTRFAVALGGRPETFLGLAGVGDLVTTCYSPHGRNRSLGERIGRGATLDEAAAELSGVAEGAYTARSVEQQARQIGVEMPITREVDQILYEDRSPWEAVSALMLRMPKEEGT